MAEALAVGTVAVASDALYIIAVWLVVGMSFGLLSTAYGACRKVYRPWLGIWHFFDWFWFVLAGGTFVVVLFWTEWGMFRIWTVVFVLFGYLLWGWLAAPLMLEALSFLGWLQARAVHYLCIPGLTVARVVKNYTQALKNPPPKE